MHGNILDANSTNKLINQSVKDAVDNKLIESGCVTKDLLEAETTRATEQENSLKTLIGAETSARTKGDEDLSSKIKAEQTRAEGKEKEISDKLAIVDGDSNTEGSFRKAIADVVAAAPEDLDTLKEIADKLAGKQDKGNYITYSSKDNSGYTIDNAITITSNNSTNKTKLGAGFMTVYYNDNVIKYSTEGIKSSKFHNCLVTSDGTFEPISDFVLSSAYTAKIAALEARIAALEAKHPEATA